MESLKNLYSAARSLFFVTGGFLFLLAFLLHNGILVPYAKIALFLLDLPFLFFALTFFGLKIRLRSQEMNNLPESLFLFFALLIFGFVLFFQFAYPDLI